MSSAWTESCVSSRTVGARRPTDKSIVATIASRPRVRPKRPNAFAGETARHSHVCVGTGELAADGNKTRRPSVETERSPPIKSVPGPCFEPSLCFITTATAGRTDNRAYGFRTPDFGVAARTRSGRRYKRAVSHQSRPRRFSLESFVRAPPRPRRVN